MTNKTTKRSHIKKLIQHNFGKSIELNIMLQNTYKWEHYIKQVAQVLGISQREHCKSHLRICKHRNIRYCPKIFMESLNKQFNEWCGFHRCTQIYEKPNSRVRKLGRNYIEWFNPCGDQTTHFDTYIENPNVDNSSCNHKNVRTTFDAKPTICVSSAKERKTKIGWIVIVRQRAQRWTRTNNVPPNGSPCYVPNSDEMIMISQC
jgi:hypothetical protein